MISNSFKQKQQAARHNADENIRGQIHTESARA